MKIGVNLQLNKIDFLFLLHVFKQIVGENVDHEWYKFKM